MGGWDAECIVLGMLCCNTGLTQQGLLLKGALWLWLAM
jgi:hypothetical protein